MRRQTGTKDKLSKRIIYYFPDVKGLDYYEPFAGVAYMARTVIHNELPFRAFYLSEKFEWAYNYLMAIRGDLLFDGEDIVDKIQQYRDLLLPTEEHEDEIRETFELMKEPCCAGDPFAYLFLCTHAVKQFVLPQSERKNIASFAPRYFRGLYSLKIQTALEWRWILKQTQITNTCA